MPNKDSLQRFLFESSPIRGGLIKLNLSWQTVLQRQAYPPSLRELLGQMLAASSLLCASLKFKGTLTLQIQGNGPLKLAVAEATHDRTFRGIVKWEGDLADDPADLLADTYMMMTLAPESGRPYQGIVDVQDGNFVHGLEEYMQRSQQIPTRMWLTANDQTAAGLMLQRTPTRKTDDPETVEDDWRRLGMLSDTLSKEELTQLPFTEILHRLYSEETVRLYDREPISFRCSCNRDRVANTLRMLGYDDIQDLLEERNQVDVRCEYCNHQYVFDRIDVEQAFVAMSTDQPSTRH